jgi:hypothetical protein
LTSTPFDDNRIKHEDWPALKETYVKDLEEESKEADLSEAKGGQGRPKEAKGGQRRPKEAKGGQRRPKEAKGGQRRPKEAKGGQRRPESMTHSL